jgi:hypothetical protein
VTRDDEGQSEEGGGEVVDGAVPPVVAEPAEPATATEPAEPATATEPATAAEPEPRYLDPSVDPTPPRRPRPTGPIQYKGSDLEPERGPGLGCFRFQVIVLAVLIVLTPLSVAWDWPFPVSAALLFIVIFLLLITGQTIIFLLRLVAADRRTRRRPMGSATKTVGELEDAAMAPTADAETIADPAAEHGPEPDPPTAAAPALPAARHPTALDRPRATIPSGRRKPTPVCPREDRTNVPVLATYFSVRRGRDPFFKFFMRTIFPKQVKDYEEKFGIKFIGWFNVAHGWDFDNVILLDLPDYATLDKLEADEATRALGHRAGEWIFERHHSMFLRERMGPDLEYHP